MKTLCLGLVLVAVAANLVVQPEIRADIKPRGDLSQQAAADNEIGIGQYPRVTYLPEATQRLLDAKAPSWILARVYHTADSVKEVVKYYKDLAQRVNKPSEANPILK